MKSLCRSASRDCRYASRSCGAYGMGVGRDGLAHSESIRTVDDPLSDVAGWKSMYVTARSARRVGRNYRTQLRTDGTRATT